MSKDSEYCAFLSVILLDSTLLILIKNIICKCFWKNVNMLSKIEK